MTSNGCGGGLGLVKMNDAGAEAALNSFGHVRSRIEAQKRLSLTYDQGREMTAHQRLTQAAGVKVYFVDLHSPLQGGVNENTNLMLRQYLPKGSSPKKNWMRLSGN